MQNFELFGLERLEDRTLLAVNVTQSGAKLTITGDDYDNVVFLNDDSGGIRVRADVDGDQIFDIDEIYYGVESVKITLRGGDDSVGVAGITIEQSIAIDTGAGDDSVGFGDYDHLNEIDGNVAITTGNGDDDVAFAGTEVTGNLAITTGNGEDYVGIGDQAQYYDPVFENYYAVYGYTEIRGNTVINTGNHDDDVYIQLDGSDYDVEFRGNLTIGTGAGDDYVSFGGNTSDYLHVHGNFSLQFGAGDDYLDVDQYGQTTFYGKVVINGGGGYDEINDIGDWFEYADDTFAGGIGAVKFVKIEAFS